MPTLDDYLSAGKLEDKATAYGITAAGKAGERQAMDDLYKVRRSKSDTIFSTIAGTLAVSGSMYDNYTKAMDIKSKAEESLGSTGYFRQPTHEKKKTFFDDLLDRVGYAFGKEPEVTFLTPEGTQKFKAIDVVNARDVISKGDVKPWTERKGKNIYDFFIGEDRNKSAQDFTKKQNIWE